MKKLFMVLFFLCSASLFAEWDLKVDGVASVIFGSKVRKVFGQVWPGARAELSHSLKGELDYWVGVDVFQAKGNFIGLEKDVALTYLPVGVGLKLKTTVLPRVDAYLGGGPRFGVLSIQNDTSNTNKLHRSLGWGGTGFTGLNLALSENIFIDLMSNVSLAIFPNTGMSGPVPSLNLRIGAYDFATGLKVKF